MHVSTLWKQSLELCTFNAVKLFALLTLKAVWDALRILATWWIAAVLTVFLLLHAGHVVDAGFLILSTAIFRSISYVFFVLAARPSVALKDGDYFKENIVNSICVILAFSCVMLIGSFLFPFFFWFLIRFFLSDLFLTLALLFYFDRTEGPWMAIRRAVRMIWYNAPVFVLYSVLFLLCAVGIVVIDLGIFSALLTSSDSLRIVTSRLLGILLDLTFVCLITNLYIKLVYTQYELYFPEDMPDLQ